MKQCQECGKPLRIGKGKGRKNRRYCRVCLDGRKTARKVARQVKNRYVKPSRKSSAIRPEQHNEIVGQYIISMTIEKVIRK